MLFSRNELLIVLGDLSFSICLMAHFVAHCKMLFANSGPILYPALANCKCSAGFKTDVTECTLQG
jgi:hypothetical protein